MVYPREVVYRVSYNIPAYMFIRHVTAVQYRT